jgi:hypothetical protein
LRKKQFSRQKYKTIAQPHLFLFSVIIFAKKTVDEIPKNC